MKKKPTLWKTAALVILLAIGGFVWNGTQVRAFNPPTDSPREFGLVGITPGQTIRINVVNTDSTRQGELPPDPCRVVLTFLDTAGQHFRNRDGSLVRRVVQLRAGHATSLELNANEFVTDGGRLQLRAVVTETSSTPGGAEIPPPVPDRTVATVEIINNATLQTSFVMPGESRMGRPDGNNHNETLVRDL